MKLYLIIWLMLWGSEVFAQRKLVVASLESKAPQRIFLHCTVIPFMTQNIIFLHLYYLQRHLRGQRGPGRGTMPPPNKLRCCPLFQLTEHHLGTTFDLKCKHPHLLSQCGG